MKKSVVAILGRPNVGKSTLFNRILRKREAIVDNEPGVTRDRNYASTDWAGIKFELLDTGGYVPESDDVFEKAIREQVNLAIHEAHVIIFLTDAITGITPLDEEIAEILQKCNVKILLAVNKVDNQQSESAIHEFYSLGLGDPFPISAMAGRNIGDLLDIILSLMPGSKNIDAEDTENIKIAVLGRPNVGKSSYINTILGQNKLIVTEIAGTTRDSIDTEIQYKKNKIILIDTAGLRKKARVHENIEYFSNVRTINSLRRCDIAIILLDATQGITDQDKKIIKNTVDVSKGLVLGVNKWDLIEKDTMTARKFELEIKNSFRELAYIPVMFISSLTKQRVFRLLDMAISVFEERNKQVRTAELNRFLERAVAQHHPPAFGDKYVKLNYVTQVKINPPVFIFFTNEPKGIKKNYRNFLENQLRSQFGFMGVPIKLIFRKKN